MYCSPSTAKLTGKPLTGPPSTVSQSTSPVVASQARKRRFVLPAKTRPPPVVITDIIPAGSSKRHSDSPVRAETASRRPTVVLFGASRMLKAMP